CPVLLLCILVNLFVIKATESWSDTMSLSHIEILSEVLVSAPPIGPDHRNTFVSSDLMEVRISDIVLLSVYWETSVTVCGTMLSVSLSNLCSPVGNHLFLLYKNANQNQFI